MDDRDDAVAAGSSSEPCMIERSWRRSRCSSSVVLLLLLLLLLLAAGASTGAGADAGAAVVAAGSTVGSWVCCRADEALAEAILAWVRPLDGRPWLTVAFPIGTDAAETPAAAWGQVTGGVLC